MVNPLDFLFLILATWRVSRFITSEDGPFDIAKRWRILMGVSYAANGFPAAISSWSKLWVCPLCVSFWVGWFFTAIYWYAPALFPAIIILAVSGGSCLLEFAIRKR